MYVTCEGKATLYAHVYTTLQVLRLILYVVKHSLHKYAYEVEMTAGSSGTTLASSDSHIKTNCRLRNGRSTQGTYTLRPAPLTIVQSLQTVCPVCRKRQNLNNVSVFPAPAWVNSWT